MRNFDVSGLESSLQGLENIDGLDQLWSFLGAASVIVVFFIILIGIAILLAWIFSSIGLMNLAKKNNITNGWLAFFPVGRSYIIGKLGFEVYNKENKNYNTFMWITFGLGAASFLLGSSSGDLHTLIRYGLLFFESWAFYNMFKKLAPKNAIVYTVFTALTGSLLGGVFLYFMKLDTVNANQQSVSEASVVEEKKETKKETKKEDTKTAGFCSNCGTKLAKGSKFCANCGNKVN